MERDTSMEAFYDKELGVAFGPYTKEEMLDDLLDTKRNVDERKTIHCDPSFLNKHERIINLVETDTVENLMFQKQQELLDSSLKSAVSYKDIIEESSNHETSNYEQFSFDRSLSEIDFEIVNYADIEKSRLPTVEALNDSSCIEVFDSPSDSNKSLKISSVTNRLPTPAILDDDTFDHSVGEHDSFGDYEDNTDQLDVPDVLPTSPKFIEETSDEVKDFTNVDGNNLLDVPDVLPTSSKLIKEISDEVKNIINVDGNNLLDVLDALTISSKITDEIYEEVKDISNDNGNNLLDLQNKPAANIIAEDYHSDGSEDKFNDTLEEMERLLNEGLNYSMHSNTDEKRTSIVHEQLPTKLVHAPPEKSTSNSKSIVSHIKPPLVVKSNFSSNKGAISKKIPMSCLKSPVTPTSTRKYNAIACKSDSKSNQNVLKCTKTFMKPLPTSVRKPYKNIESPVSIYIKNSARAPIYQKVTPLKPLSTEKNKAVKLDKNNKESKENSVVFPEVNYKPAKTKVITRINPIKLPNSIQSLIPQKTNVIKHGSRIAGNAQKQSSVSRKLLEVDLTINSNCSLDTTEDISIHFSKKAYIE